MSPLQFRRQNPGTFSDHVICLSINPRKVQSNRSSKTSHRELFSIMKLLIRRGIIITHFCAKHTTLASGGIVPHQHSKVSKYKTSQVFSAWPKVSTTKSQNRERHHSRVNGRVISVPNWTKKGNFFPSCAFSQTKIEWIHPLVFWCFSYWNVWILFSILGKIT